jgi:hypothetical protein
MFSSARSSTTEPPAVLISQAIGQSCASRRATIVAMNGSAGNGISVITR